MSVIDVFNEIKNNQIKWGISDYHFYDDNLMINPEWVDQFTELIISTGLKINWICLSRPEIILKHKELLPKMKSAGCKGFELGFETDDDGLYLAMNKKNIKSTFRKAYEYLCGVNFEMVEFLVMSFYVGETLQSLFRTNEALRQYKKQKAFLCFYDFATEVRRKYNRMDFLVSCFSGLYFVFSRTINFLIINYGLQEIYLSCEKIISHYANELQSRSILDSFYRKNEVNLFHNTMKEIVDYFLSGCEKGNLYLQEINKFDENIYLYMTCGFETEMVFKLQCNVFDNMWNTNPTYYKIYRAGGKLYVERLAKE